MRHSRNARRLSGYSPFAAESDGAGRNWPIYVLFALVAAAMHLAIAYGALPDRGISLIDPDSYMRLVRVQALLDGQGWWNGTIARSNAPYGETMHWTRPLDVLLIALMQPFRVALSQAASLHWAGVIVSPLLQIATCIAGVWAARPLAERHALWVMPALLLQPSIVAYAAAGRADHHILILLAFVLALGATLRAIVEADDRRASALAGVFTGFGLWLSIEFIAEAALLGGGLAAAWLWADARMTRARSGQLLAFAAAGLAMLAAALVIERAPQDWLAVEYDRISIVHLSAAALGTVAVWMLRLRLLSGSFTVKLLSLGVLGGLALGTLRAAFPLILAGPMAQVDPRMMTQFVDKVIEMRSLWPVGLAQAGDALQNLGALLIALPVVAVLALRAPSKQEAAGWLFVAGALAVTCTLALIHFRFAPLMATIAALPLAVVIGEGFAFFRSGLMAPWGAGVATLFVVGVLMLPPALAHLPGLVDSSEANAATPPTVLDCSHAPIIDVLNAIAEPKIILNNSISLGPVLLYRTRHSVVTTPYHRNAPGLIDAAAVWGATTDDAAARAVVERRGVGLLLVCRNVGKNFWPAEDTRGETLHARLLAGETPDWLTPIELPPAAAAFGLYAVRPAGT